MDRMFRFRTLLLREWMQHRTGWLVLMALPTLLVLGLGLFDGQGIQVGSADAGDLSALPRCCRRCSGHWPPWPWRWCWSA